MQAVLRVLSGVVLLVLSTMAQTIAPNPAAATGTIAGRVTVGATAVAGVEVLLKVSGNPAVTDFLSTGPVPTATTRTSIPVFLVKSGRICSNSPEFCVEVVDWTMMKSSAAWLTAVG